MLHRVRNNTERAGAIKPGPINLPHCSVSANVTDCDVWTLGQTEIYGPGDIGNVAWSASNVKQLKWHKALKYEKLARLKENRSYRIEESTLLKPT